MFKAVIYLRVSTERQADSGLGMEAQLAACHQARLKLGCSPNFDVFRDEGVSGTLPLADRPGLLDAVAALGKDDVLLVARRDRLGRDVINVALIEREIAKRGARVISAAGEASELEGPTGQLIRTILDAVAAFERATIALRTRAALQAKRARGEITGNIPWGWKESETEPGKLVINVLEAQITRIVQWLRAQGYTLRDIVEKLRVDGYLGRSGNPITLKRVHEITTMQSVERAAESAT